RAPPVDARHPPPTVRRLAARRSKVAAAVCRPAYRMARSRPCLGDGRSDRARREGHGHHSGHTTVSATFAAGPSPSRLLYGVVAAMTKVAACVVGRTSAVIVLRPAGSTAVPLTRSPLGSTQK